MESMLFFIQILFFWIPSFFLLAIGLVLHKKRSLSKLLYILSFVSFSIPWLLKLGLKLDEAIKINNITGTYSGKDDYSNNIMFEIKRNNECILTLNHCEKPNISGKWQYVDDYDNFLFYMDIVEISFADNDKGEIILYSDTELDCLPVNEVKLKKIKR